MLGGGDAAVKRTSITLIVDQVTVQGASSGRKAEEHEDVCRLSETAPRLEDLPLILRKYLPKSLIYDK